MTHAIIKQRCEQCKLENNKGVCDREDCLGYAFKVSDWKKGQWLKGMGLSGSQAGYILACCGRIEADARKEIGNGIEKM